MMSRRRGAGAQGRGLIFGIIALVGCSAPPRPSAPASDSAGIAIINNTIPLWAEGHGWMVAESATVDIGVVRAPEGALRLSDGRIVVADGRPIGLRYFGADGRELYSVGGAADGPGELQSLFHLDLGLADTIIAFDLAKRQAVLFDRNGALAGAIPLATELTPAGSNGFLPKGLAPDGRYLLQRDEAPFPFPGAAGSVRTDSTRVFWLSRSGALADSSSRLVAGELFGFPLAEQGGTTLIAPLARPLAPALHVAGGRDRVWIGDGGTWEVRGLGTSGAVERIVRLPLPLDTLTAEMQDGFVTRYRARVESFGGNPLQRQFAAGMATAPFPARLPAFGDMLAGEDSTLWLLHTGLTEDGPSTWSILDAAGRWLGEIRLPPHFRATAVGRGWVLGIQLDATGVSHVRLYPILER